MMTQYPELDLMYHIPNEGKRSKVLGMILKAMGLKPGVPDLCLPVPRCGYGALYIEMKSRTGMPSADQKRWLVKLTRAGNCAVVCREWTAAAKFIEQYLKGELKREVD